MLMAGGKGGGSGWPRRMTGRGGGGDNRRRGTTAQLQHCPSCDRSDASAHWRLLHASMQAGKLNKAGADGVATLFLVELRSCLLKQPPINGKHQLGLLMRDN